MLFQKGWLADELVSKIGVAQDQELVLEVANQGLPRIALDHIKHHVNLSSLRHEEPQLRLEGQDRISFVDEDHSFVTEQVIGSLADAPLLRGFHQIYFSRNVNQFLSHAQVASLRVHAEVAVLETIGLCVVLGGAFPRKEPLEEAFFVLGFIAAEMTLVR